MSRTDFDLLSTVPPEEECSQVGGHTYSDDARVEGKRYIELLRKFLGTEPAGSQFKFAMNPHDLGTYYTVRYVFDDEDETHVTYMRRIEDEGPASWDDTPR